MCCRREPKLLPVHLIHRLEVRSGRPCQRHNPSQIHSSLILFQWAFLFENWFASPKLLRFINTLVIGRFGTSTEATAAECWRFEGAFLADFEVRIGNKARHSKALKILAVKAWLMDVALKLQQPGNWTNLWRAPRLRFLLQNSNRFSWDVKSMMMLTLSLCDGEQWSGLVALCADEGEDAEFQCSLLMIIRYWLMIFSRMRSKGSRFTLGVWNLRVCSLDVVQPFATVPNRSQPSANVRVRSLWPCLWRILQKWS